MASAQRKCRLRVLHIPGNGSNVLDQEISLSAVFASVWVFRHEKGKDFMWARDEIARLCSSFRPDVITAHAAGSGKALSGVRGNGWCGPIVLMNPGGAVVGGLGAFAKEYPAQTVTAVIPTEAATAADQFAALACCMDRRLNGILCLEVNDGHGLDGTMADSALLRNVVEATYDRHVRLINRIAHEARLQSERHDLKERRKSQSGGTWALEPADLKKLQEQNKQRRASYSSLSSAMGSTDGSSEDSLSRRSSLSPTSLFRQSPHSWSRQSSRRTSTSSVTSRTFASTHDFPTENHPAPPCRSHIVSETPMLPTVPDIASVAQQITAAEVTSTSDGGGSKRRSTMVTARATRNTQVINVDLDLQGGKKKFGFSTTGCGFGAGGTGIVISWLAQGGLAHQTGKVAIGDVVESVNGVRGLNLTREVLAHVIAQSTRLRLQLKRPYGSTATLKPASSMRHNPSSTRSMSKSISLGSLRPRSTTKSISLGSLLPRRSRSTTRQRTPEPIIEGSTTSIHLDPRPCVVRTASLDAFESLEALVQNGETAVPDSLERSSTMLSIKSSSGLQRMSSRDRRKTSTV